MSRYAHDPSNKEWMDEFVQTLKEGFKNDMLKTRPDVSRQRISPSNRNQDSRSNTTNSQRPRAVRLTIFRIGEITTAAEIIFGKDLIVNF